jgi:hypothetical protein
MEKVKFKKDFEKYSKGDVINSGSYLGAMLIDRGIAEATTEPLKVADKKAK